MKRAFFAFLGFAAVLYLLFTLLPDGINMPEIIEEPPVEVRKMAIVVDTHSDTLMKIIDEKTWLPSVDIGKETEFHIDIPKLKKGGVGAQYFGAFTAGYYTNGKPDFDRANSRLLALINALHWTVKNNPENIGLAMSVEDIERLAGSSRISAVLSIEGAYSIEEKYGIELLCQYRDLGVRMVGLTWNHSNALGEGANNAYMDGTPSQGGLTDFGREFVAEMNRLGIIIDVSHMNEATFWDVIKVSRAPVIASHSGAYSLRNHARNLKDDQIKAIADGGGVVQVVFYPGFLAYEGENVTVETIADHIEYIANLAGVDHVGIGSDFDGAAMPEDLKDASMIPRLAEELRRRGYGEEKTEKIMGKNTMRVMEEVWGKAGNRQERGDAPEITPHVGMGEALESSTPVLTAQVKAAEGARLDVASFRVIVDGRVYTPDYNEDTGTISLGLKEPLGEKFHVVTFMAAYTSGEVGRETRIFYIR